MLQQELQGVVTKGEYIREYTTSGLRQAGMADSMEFVCYIDYSIFLTSACHLGNQNAYFWEQPR